ncbi:hypothetical protein, partial [Nitratifractor sp.]
HYSLETVGIIVLLLMFGYIALRLGFLPDDTARVEDVAKTLNHSREGIGASSTFLLLLILSVTGGFVLLYTTAHRYFNHAWECCRNLHAYGEMIADLETRQASLKASLEGLGDNTDETAAAVITTRSDKAHTMELLQSLYKELGDLQNLHTACKAECQSYAGHFPKNLATLVGTLPICN